MTVDQKTVEEKIGKGQTLTAEEQKFVMGGPVDLVDSDEGSFGGELIGEEKTPEPKKEPAPAVVKKEDPKPAAKDPDDIENDVFFQLEQEFNKPKEQQNLSKYSPREVSYFHEMKRNRTARQKSEEDLNAALFREAKLKKEKEDLQKELLNKATPPEVDPLDDLKKKDATDFMTVGDVLKVIESVQKKSVEPKKTEDQKPKEDDKPAVDPVRMRFLQMCESEGRQKFPNDFDAVLELSGEILEKNEKYLIEVANALKRGENPAIKSYELIKADPEFAALFPAAEVRVKARQKVQSSAKDNPAPQAEKTQEQLKKEEDARKAQEALERNQTKTKTTGNMSGGEEKSIDDIDLNTISKMSDREFAKLPKKTRDKWLAANG